MKAPLAVVTMVYNEPDFLPVWLRYYIAQATAACCYVIDHGTDDGSTDSLPCNHLRLPRSAQDDQKRAHAIGHICAGLLEWYECVLYCDVDEIVMVDPDLYPSLHALALERGQPALTATGFDLLHRTQQEEPLDFSAPISLQRSALRFSAAMCKPVLIREPVLWSPGFHTVEACLPSPDPALMLFHLRYVDLDQGLRRLARTRAQPWSSEDAGRHQRMSDEDWVSLLQAMAGLPMQATDLSADDPALAYWRDRIVQEGHIRANDRYSIDLGLSGSSLWPLPKRFQGLF